MSEKTDADDGTISDDSPDWTGCSPITTVGNFVAGTF